MGTFNISNNGESPCKDCPRKGCGAYHSVCPDYQKSVKIKEQERADRIKRSQAYGDLMHVRYKNCRYKKAQV